MTGKEADKRTEGLKVLARMVAAAHKRRLRDAKAQISEGPDTTEAQLESRPARAEKTAT